MKYLLHGPIEEPGSGGGMIFLFIPGGGSADKGSHSIPSLGHRPWEAGRGPRKGLCPGPAHNPCRWLSSFSSWLFS